MPRDAEYAERFSRVEHVEHVERVEGCGALGGSVAPRRSNEEALENHTIVA